MTGLADRWASAWRVLPPVQAAPAVSLEVHAAGLCCSVGYGLKAAACALRAGMDHFQESHFLDPTGAPLAVAMLPEHSVWGSARFARWIELAIADCLRNAGMEARTAAQPLPVLWLAPEPGRTGGTDLAWHQQVFSHAMHSLGMATHPLSGVLPLGRAGISEALRQSAQWIGSGQVQQVLLVGADSLLDAATIGALLQQQRLLCPSNSDGFLPGEAAAAVLLCAETGTSHALLVAGAGQGQETGRPDGSAPSRAEGLTNAMREALAQARLDLGAVEFRVSDQNGESFFAREAANAFTRVLPEGADRQATLTLADKIGEVGAAMGPAMLAWLHALRPQASKRLPTRPGATGILHLANDDGLRAAVVVRYASPN
jgi:3-oxoacyl-[acyl-carrier-protein] synthase I